MPIVENMLSKMLKKKVLILGISQLWMELVMKS